MVAKGYLTKLLANAAVKSYIERKEPEILSHLELVANTVSMEEAVQQKLGEDGKYGDTGGSESAPSRTSLNAHA